MVDMPKVTVPNELEKHIIEENKMDPDHYGILFRDDDTIPAPCFQ